MKNEVVMYDYEGSPCARRVKIFLIEKGINYTIQKIDLSKMQQKSADYLRINPNGLVPAINHNGRVIYESSVINEYLEDHFPKVKLIPESDIGRIEAKQWENHELAMANVYRPLMYSKTMGPLHHVACNLDEFLSISAKATDNQAHLSWQEKVWKLKVLSLQEQREHQKVLSQFIDLVERRLENRKYLVGEQFSSADISVYPRLTMLPLVGVDITPYSYPNVSTWIERISKRRSIRETYTDTEKNMARMNSVGLTAMINRVVYQDSPRNILQNVFLKSLRPILRKKLNIEESLRSGGERFSPVAVPSIKGEFRNVDSRRLSMPEFLKNEPLMLYGYKGSPVTERVALLCRLLGVEYTYIDIDMARLEHTDGPFKYLNPTGELPILLHGDTVIHDSLFMAEYLSSQAASKFFLQDSYEQAKIRMWNAFDMGMRKEYRPLFFAMINNEPITSEEKMRCYEVQMEKMDYLEMSLTRKAFLVSDQFTYADIALYTRIIAFESLGIQCNEEKYPSIIRWMENVAKLVGKSSDLIGKNKTQASKKKKVDSKAVNRKEAGRKERTSKTATN